MRVQGAVYGAMIWAASASGAFAQPSDAAVQKARNSAYAAAMKCFVANGHAMGMRQRVGDAAKAAYYETKARKSFDTALALGGALGFSGSHINQDLGLAQARELPPMVSNERYFSDGVATCKALGLM